MAISVKFWFLFRMFEALPFLDFCLSETTAQKHRFDYNITSKCAQGL